MNQSKGVAVRKRAQIASANKVMLFWVIGVSVVFGISVVVVIFLTQMLFFNERVLSEKNKTNKNLEISIRNVPKLENNVKKLDANQSLIDSKSKSDDKAIQAIIEALPSDANSLALGASLQNKILAEIPGLSIVSLQVEPVAGVENDSSSGQGFNEISFNFSVSGDDNALRQVLERLEKSIRTIDVLSVSISSQGGNRLMSIKARAYYEPAVKVELKDKVIK